MRPAGEDGMTKTRELIHPFRLKSKLFRGFSDPSRLSILETLRDESRIVGDIAATTGLTQPNVSNHLKCLSECGLVIGEPNGRFVHYRLADHRIARLLQLADRLLVASAHLIQECENYRETSVSSKGRTDTKRKSKQRLSRDRRSQRVGSMAAPGLRK
jgi:DNA-binding transcriptional ArsR family regulator